MSTPIPKSKRPLPKSKPIATRASSFDDYDCLAEQMFEMACDRSTLTDIPVGVVLAGVIFHLAVEAQVADIPEEMLRSVVSSAATDYRALLHAPTQAEIAQ
ncbi:hypothetical protein [Pseudomonas sp.]|uniref:hypothetical protein n=1 Tax=Pseudomonas sp. TaxID=306 RepID=UPI00261CA056|nr:hypothetical protein [Pseudomonas sp.]